MELVAYYKNVLKNKGELVFDAPWQSRVFALADAVVEQAFGGDREPFRQELIKAIAAEPDRPYWESWTAALEALVPALPRGAGSGRSAAPPGNGCSAMCPAWHRRRAA